MLTYHTLAGTRHKVFEGSPTPAAVWGYDAADGSDNKVTVASGLDPDLSEPVPEVFLAVWAGDDRIAHVALTPTDAYNLAQALLEASRAAEAPPEPVECPTCGALYGEMDHAPEPCERLP